MLIRRLELGLWVGLGDIGVVVSFGKQTKYMDVGHHLGMIVNRHIMVDSNLYEKVKVL